MSAMKRILWVCAAFVVGMITGSSMTHMRASTAPPMANPSRTAVRFHQHLVEDCIAARGVAVIRIDQPQGIECAPADTLQLLEQNLR